MNIDSIKNYPTGGSAGIKQKHSNVLEFKKKNAFLSENKIVNRGYYGGSFTGINMNRAAANILANNKSHKFSEFGYNMLDKINSLCEQHTVIAQNLVALFLAAGLRPIAIMSLPGKKDKEDKIYASGHSIASGLIGLGFSSIVMLPLGQAAKKAKEKFKNLFKASELLKKETLTDDDIKLADKLKKSFNVENLKDIENSKLFKKLKGIYKLNSLEEFSNSHLFAKVSKVIDMAPDVLIFGVLKAMLTIALIPPILKYGFGLEKKKKAPQVAQAQQPQVQPEQQTNENKVQAPSMMSQMHISSFIGGAK